MILQNLLMANTCKWPSLKAKKGRVRFDENGQLSYVRPPEKLLFQSILFCYIVLHSIVSHDLARLLRHYGCFPSCSLFRCPGCAGKVHSCLLFNSVFPPLFQSTPSLFSPLPRPVESYLLSQKTLIEYKRRQILLLDHERGYFFKALLTFSTKGKESSRLNGFSRNTIFLQENAIFQQATTLYTRALY